MSAKILPLRESLVSTLSETIVNLVRTIDEAPLMRVELMTGLHDNLRLLNQVAGDLGNPDNGRVAKEVLERSEEFGLLSQSIFQLVKKHGINWAFFKVSLFYINFACFVIALYWMIFWKWTIMW